MIVAFTSARRLLQRDARQAADIARIGDRIVAVTVDGPTVEGIQRVFGRSVFKA
jgi:hypothetical protein